MSDGRKSRVTSSETPCGSQYPIISVENMDSVQPVLRNPQPLITLEVVNRVLEAGRILRAVLTPEELSALPDVLSGVKRGHNTSLQRD